MQVIWRSPTQGDFKNGLVETAAPSFTLNTDRDRPGWCQPAERAVSSRSLVIIHETTADFGERPWPPLGGDYWSIVKRERGLTTWRRFALVKTIRRDDATRRIAKAKPRHTTRQEEK
jgi:hypothetical protein